MRDFKHRVSFTLSPVGVSVDGGRQHEKLYKHFFFLYKVIKLGDNEC